MLNATNLDRFQDIIVVDEHGNGPLRFQPIEVRLDFNSKVKRRLQKAVSWLLRGAFAIWCTAYGISSMWEPLRRPISQLPILFVQSLQHYEWFCDLTVCHGLAVILMLLTNQFCFLAIYKRRKREIIPMSANALRPWLLIALSMLCLETALVAFSVENGLLAAWFPTSHSLSVGIGLAYAVSLVLFAYSRVESHFSKFV